MHLEEQDHNSQVDLTLGEILTLRLDENPTAGFRWHMVTNGEPVCVLLDDTFEPGAPAPGQAGTHAWRFRAADRGRSALEFVYRRPWEHDSADGRTFRVTVQVRER